MCEEIEPIAELNFGEGPPIWEMIEQLCKEMAEAMMLPKEFFDETKKQSKKY